MKLKVSILIILIGILGFANISFAEENRSPLEINPKFTHEQEDGVNNYISIKVEEDFKREIFEFSLRNTSDESQDVIVSVVNAYTSPSGVTQYTKDESTNSKIIDDNYKMSTHLSLEDSDENGDRIITLKAGEEKVITTSLDAKGMEGILLGGVSFQIYDEGEEIEQEGSSFKINNKINMIIGVKIDFNTDKDVNIILDEPYVDPMPSYYAIRLPLTMDSPLFKKVGINYEVLLNDEVLFDDELSYEFAPKTKTNVSLPWASDTIKNDTDYQLRGTLVYKDSNGEEKEQPFNFNFKHSPERNVINDITTAITKPIEEGKFPWILLATAIVAIFALVTFIHSRRGNYILTESDEFPKLIHEHQELYSKVRRKEGAIDENEFAIYRKKKKGGKHYYELIYIGIKSNDGSQYKINK